MAGNNGRTLAKDFHQLLKNVHGMSGGQVIVTDWEDDLTSIKMTVTPTDGYYKGGQFVFEIKPSRGEDVPPRVYCKTMIYHPNIDTIEDDGEICLNLLEDDMWTSERNLEDVVQGVLFLLYNPNLEDPLTCIFSPDMTEDEYEENVKLSLEGASIEGYQFPKPKIRCGDTEGEMADVIEVREEPDGAEDVHVDNESEESDVKIKEEVKAINRVNSVEVNEIVNIEPGCNINDEDEGTPVDGPYPYVKNAADVKAKIEGIVCSGNDHDSLNPRGVPGKVDPGRFNFWWGIAIRRVRTWNVF